MSKRNVVAAWDMLLDELRTQIDEVNRSGGAALSSGDLAAAARAVQVSASLAGIVADLRSLDERLKAALDDGPDQGHVADTLTVYGASLRHPPVASAMPSVTRQSVGRGRKREQLPQGELRVPILQALVEMGGRGAAATVTDRVGELVKGRLTELDYANVKSGQVRWRNKTAFCRNELKNQGLLRSDSPQGIWEISEAGRRWLEEQG